MKNDACSARGRPRKFDPAQALDRALEVFWRKGYEGASLGDLTGAMGINRPSLYAAYGNKEALFRKVLDRYAERTEAKFRHCLEAPTAREVAARLLGLVAESAACPQGPRACLLVGGSLTCGDEAERMRQELVRRRGLSENALRQRFERARAEGDLPPDACPDDLARFLATVQQGMSVQAVGGACRESLDRVAAVALRAWPAK